MSRCRVHFIWFFHQPFFIPDREILWRIDSTYLPLLDALRDRSIKCSIGITGSLLERCATLRPDFILELARAIDENRISLLGTTAYHPVLPWLSSRSARAQILVDQEIKARLGLPVSKVFWPTELAWSMRIGALAKEFGYESVVIDSSSRDAADLLPRWSDTGHGLHPVVEFDQCPGTASKMETQIGSDSSGSSLQLWVRERALSNVLLNVMHSDDEDERSHFQFFSAALHAVQGLAVDPGAPLIIADDAERFLPNGLARFLDLLDSARDASIDFSSAKELDERPCDKKIGYVPASTMEETEAMWLATIDDAWYRRHLTHLTERVEARFDLLKPGTADEHHIRTKILRAQDSSFYFWHYVSRTRRDFYADLLEVERWLDAGS